MDYLAPPLNAVLQIQMKIKNGLSVRAAIKSYIRQYAHCPFCKQINLWFLCLEAGKPFFPPDWTKKIYRKILVEILHRGLKGEPIAGLLKEFEEELKTAALQDLEEQIQKLPFISLIPLFLFQVPAFFILLLAPLLLDLQSHFIH